METFGRYFRKDRLFYIPDISFYLKNFDIPKIKNVYSNNLKNIRRSGTKVIAFCLNRHIYSVSRCLNYKDIVLEFVKTIMYLLQRKHFIVLLPFNTNDKNSENDIIFHTDIYDLLDTTSQKNVMNIKSRLDVIEMFDIFKYFDLVIPMRFHACLFSIYQNVPLIPLLTTKKVTNVLLDIKWNYLYKLETDANDIPLKMESSVLISKINEILQYDKDSHKNGLKRYDLMKDLKQHLTVACDEFKMKMQNPVKDLLKIIQSDNNEKVSTCINTNKKIIEILIKKLSVLLNIKFSSPANIFDLSNVTEDMKSNVLEVVSFYLTHSYDSKYNYGLMSKMFQKGYDYYNEWDWVLCDNQKNGLLTINNSNGIFNMNYIDQNDYSGAHRSGWQHVVSTLQEQNSDSSKILLDLSIDKTFHWKEDVGKLVGIIPYTKKWIGFLHHTFDTTFSEYNSKELLQKETFRESLINCEGIIVFSKSLKEKLRNELKKIGFDIKVTVLCHPTMTLNVEKFTWNKFTANNDKKIVNVGGWMRNIFSFYNLFIPKNYCFDRKNDV
jgi:Polysaccharide pyruvyl transferase